MQNTPLYNAMLEKIAEDLSRFHTPGHKGILPEPFAAAALYDFTEVDGLDSLFEAEGPILQTEKRYSALYETAGSFISAGGSTLAIQAMLSMVAHRGKKVLMSRNVHVSAINACALLDLEPVWIYPNIPEGDNPALPARIAPHLIDQMLQKQTQVAAVFITSPNYYGQLEDIREIAKVCKKHSVQLLVDNAHGAHLAFLQGGLHPIAQGAAACSDSLHKTMATLTGAAMLHVGSAELLPTAKGHMALFGSTSPSYLIMLSVDMLLADLESGQYKKTLEKTVAELEALRCIAAQNGFLPLTTNADPLKLTINFAAKCYGKEEFLAALKTAKIEPEYTDAQNCVLMFSASNTAQDFERVNAFLHKEVKAGPKPADAAQLGSFVPPKRQMSLRSAIFAASEYTAVEGCLGRTAAELISRCPPGMAITVPGEVVDEFTIQTLKNAHIKQLKVVK